DGVTQRIVNLINGAQADVNVSTMLITRTDISGAIIQKHNNGIPATHVMVSTQNPSGNQFLTLQSALPTNQAIRYNQGGTLHHKFMVVDHSQGQSQSRVLTGSHNWSTSAETRNDENTVVVHDTN
ncbi:phospholipase D-like domain-containing protein, partial [Arthrospira platensis SPKY1]|nr:phospholipase D-like domain-containing protein [Arthrospira platensis SPKY1]